MMPTLSGYLLVMSALLLKGLEGLKVTELHVPEYMDRGSTAKLVCNFDMGGAKLYSVKWYKDENEFFRFMPEQNPHIQKFHLNGVSLDDSQSSINHVMLTNLQASSSGSYRCEVSTEGPNFVFDHKTDNMTVLAYPQAEPKLEGFHDTYSIDDVVFCKCNAAPSFPAPQLQWYINNEKANEFLVEQSNPVRHTNETFSASSTLKFSAERQHFLGAVGVLTLRCDAVAPPLHTVSSSVTARLQGAFPNQQLAQDDLRNSGARRVLPPLATVLMFMTIIST